MPLDSTFSTKLQLTIASLKAWTGFVADVARVEEAEDDTAWGLALTPKSPLACPVEIALRKDQHYDLKIAGEIYQDRPITSFDVFLPLLESIVDGRVLTRRVLSSVTGIERSVATVVTLPDGRVFEDGQVGPHDLPPAGLGDTPTEIRDTHYLPYRRPD